MKAPRGGYFIALAAVALAVLLFGFHLWSLDAESVLARTSLSTKSFLPALYADEGGNPPSPTRTPRPTKEPTSPAPTETAPPPTETAPAPTETAPPPTETAPAPTETAPAPPVIEAFSADPLEIYSGKSSTLSWTINGVVTGLALKVGDESNPDSVLGETELEVFPTATTRYKLIASNAGGSVSATVRVKVIAAPEQLIFDWNQEVLRVRDRGFPKVTDPDMLANGDWTSPIDYAGGTLYLRAIVRDQPEYQKMKQQFCIWQEEDGDPFALENCTTVRTVDATKLASDPDGKVEVSWSVQIGGSGWFMKDNRMLEWERPRYRYAFVIKTEAGCPVSNFKISADVVPSECPTYQDPDTGEWLLEAWAGENPDDWYALDERFTVVSVANGETFSGWNNYPDPPAPNPEK